MEDQLCARSHWRSRYSSSVADRTLFPLVGMATVGKVGGPHGGEKEKYVVHGVGPADRNEIDR